MSYDLWMSFLRIFGSLEFLGVHWISGQEVYVLELCGERMGGTK
jgi:hypothetical protein